MTRLEANREILKRLSKVVENCPDLRWHQLCQYASVDLEGDQFYEESEETLKRLKKFA